MSLVHPPKHSTPPSSERTETACALVALALIAAAAITKGGRLRAKKRLLRAGFVLTAAAVALCFVPVVAAALD
jgi:hypothetical protein